MNSYKFVNNDGQSIVIMADTHSEACEELLRQLDWALDE